MSTRLATKTLEVHLVGFAEKLRHSGLKIPLSSSIDFIKAVAEVGTRFSEDIYWAGRSTLIREPENIIIYDRVFKSHWLGITDDLSTVEELPPMSFLFDDLESKEKKEEVLNTEKEIFNVKYSSSETLTSKDFAECNEQELNELFELMNEISFAGQKKRSQRTTGSYLQNRFDFGETVRSSFRTNGEIIRRNFVEPREKNRKLVILLDVSGSMETYARALIRFVHAAIISRSDVEAFTLGTRLTRLTKELQTRNPDAALIKAAKAVKDWSGGTRLGEGLEKFNSDWGVRGMARGSSVIILSDGWDRGDPTLVSEQMERLGRVAHKIVWVNPLKATPGYAPLAKGMAAAMPHIDKFVEGHSFDSLKDLSKLLTE